MEKENEGNTNNPWNPFNAYERQYKYVVKLLLKEGFHELNQRTGISTYRFPHSSFTVSPDCTPILIGKKVFWKSAIEEILWIMQKGSNNIHDLKPHIWDEWANEDGSIGKSYGYQISEYHQVERVLHDLEKDHSCRRGVINLWNPADLDEMNLVPCCFSSVWTIVDNHLNCMLVQRSADMMLGVPFNTFQYYALMLMFAKHLGVKPGLLTHVMADPHIYENQLTGAKKYLNRLELLSKLTWIDFDSMAKEGKSLEDYSWTSVSWNSNYKSIDKNVYGYEFSDEDEFNETKKEVLSFLQDVKPNKYVPRLILDTDKTNFWDFTVDDFKMIDYHPMGKIDFEVAV